MNTTTRPLPRLSVSARAWALHPFCVFGGQWPFCSENDIVSTIGAEQSKHMHKHDRGRPEPERVSRTCCRTRRPRAWACSPWSCLSLAAPAPPSAGPAPGAARRRQGAGDTGRTAKSWLTSLEGTRSRGFSNRFLPGNLSWQAVPSLPPSVLSSHTFPLSFPPRAPDPGGNEGTASLVPGGRGAGAAGWSRRGHTQPGSGSSRAPAAPGRPQSVGPVRPLMK